MAERITVEHVNKSYGGGNLALDDVSFEVEPGTFLVLLGPSGSGKTTLLRCLAGIERIGEGRITLGDTVVADRGVSVPPERRDLSMVFQDYALWPHLVARDNVAFALRRLALGKLESRARATAMLGRVGLGLLAERYPSELSGGEQQRVALARALVADVGLVLCDEPLSNLDADLRDRMRIEISALVRESGATAIYITHDQSEAFALADRVGVLEHGRLVQLDVPEAIYVWPASPFVARFTGLSTEITVRATGAPGPDGLLALEPTHLQRRAPILARAASGLDPERDGLLMVRPTAVHLCAPEDEGCHLVGTVTDVAFRGRGYEHAVDLADGTRVSGVLADARTARGAAAGLRLDPTGCLCFSASSEGDRAPTAPH